MPLSTDDFELADHDDLEDKSTVEKDPKFLSNFAFKKHTTAS